MKKLLLILTLVLGQLSVSAQTSGDFAPLGPKDFPAFINWQVSGVARISQMKFHPTDPNILYAVNAMGGLFISRDKGANWVATGADKLPATRCASVCIDYTNDQILYFGTGDPSYYSNGLGIWKSTNGGYTWSPANNGIGNRLAVEILMSPTDHNVLLAATNDGIWKSSDGGANWTAKKAGGDFTDMVFRPSSGTSTVYAVSHSEFWRSDNMGDTWTKVTLTDSGIVNGGRIAVSKADPSIVYLTFVGDRGAGTSTPVLKSTDNGNSFSVVRPAGGANMNGYDANSGGQGNYNYGMSADPNNINHLMIVGHIIWTSFDGGASWTQLSMDWAHQVHTDMRQIPFSPYTANEIYNINDGGIWRSWDNGNSWLPLCNGLVGTESYIGAASPLYRDQVSIGAQDNGEFYFKDGIWYSNAGGDYHSNIIHDNISANYYYDLSGSGRRRGLPSGPDYSLNLPFDAGNGQNVYTSFPLTSTQTAFIGYNDVYRSTNISNNPPSWNKISSNNVQIKALASSPTDANVLYVVTADGKIRRTDNALAQVPNYTTYNTPSDVNVTASVVVLKSNPSIVYLLCNNKVFRSTNSGANWTDVTGALPNVNYHTLLQDVNSTNEAIYLVGYNSVFYKDNSLTNWTNFSAGLPTVVNFYRAYMFNDGTDNSILTLISAGRGVWQSGLYGKKSVMRDPENPSNAIPGIVYNYYEGTWDNLPNFTSLTPVKTGSVSTVDIGVRLRDDNFAFKFEGFIDVPVDGKYNFYTSSDDGSMFYIGNDLVVNNDGLHGTIEKTGYMWLKKGKHKFTATMFEKGGDQTMNVSWDGPGISKQTIPASALYRLSPASSCPENGMISVERWSNVGGGSISNIPVNTTPTLTFTNPNFESKTDDGDNYGVRYRGYICPPYTGYYTFYIASDDDSELWLSTTGNPSNKVKIAYLTGFVNQRNWYSNASQKSAPILLVAGQKYYVEGLHKEGGGGDNFAVAWKMPSGEFEAPIRGAHLSPFKNNQFPSIAITSPANNYSTVAGTTVVVNANASDVDGTISKVEFYLDDIKVGETSSSPYSWTWNVNKGNYKLTARAIDNQNAVSVSSVINVTVTGYVNGNGDGLTANYFNGMNFETPVLSRKDAAINFDWGNGAPDPSVNANQFSARWTGQIQPKYSETYTFYANTDNGRRLWINNQLIVDKWIDDWGIEYTGTIALNAGQKYEFRMEYFENNGGANAKLEWSSASQAREVIPTSQYYSNALPTVAISSPANNATFDEPANITLTANSNDADGTISKVDFFSSNTLLGTASGNSFTWTNVPKGTYTITAIATDNRGAVTKSSPITITVNPFVNGNGNGLTGNYFNGMNFETSVLNRTDANINFDWGFGSPDPSVNADQFSARWTGQIQPRYSETYSFYLNTDNGRRLWINNQLIVDKWVDDWGIEYRGTIALAAGQKYDIKLEYFENNGGANCKLEWSSTSQSREVVPQSQLYSPVIPSALSLVKAPATIFTADDQSVSNVYFIPNPATDYINLKLDETSKVTIINNLGNIVFTQEVAAYSLLHISSLPAGLYNVKIETSSGVINTPLIKN